MLTALVIARVRSLAPASNAMSFDCEPVGDGELAGAEPEPHAVAATKSIDTSVDFQVRAARTANRT